MTIDRPPKCSRKGCRTRLEPADTGRPRLTCSTACRSALYRVNVKQARKRSVDWYTPDDVLDWFWERWGPFDLDPCSSPLSRSWHRVAHRLTLADDGLMSRWTGTRAFVNPPYGRGHLDLWVDRCYRAVVDGEVELAAMLIPLRPSSGWCRLAVERGAELTPYPRRIRFLEPVEVCAACADPRPASDDGCPTCGGTVRTWSTRQTSGALFETTALVFRDGRCVTKVLPSVGADR